MLDNLHILNLRPQFCLRERSASVQQPVNLYHKVGHGRLDMFVINPARDAKELREFMERWRGENSRTLGSFRSGINIDGKELWLPLANLVMKEKNTRLQYSRYCKVMISFFPGFHLRPAGVGA